MGICWSDPPPPPVRSTPPVYLVDKVQPTAPPYTAPLYQVPQYQVPQYPPANYTYAMPYQQQQMYNYYQARPPQQQMGTGTAIATGFVIGAVMEDILDPTE